VLSICRLQLSVTYRTPNMLIIYFTGFSCTAYSRVLVSVTNISGETSVEFTFLGGQVVPSSSWRLDAVPSETMRHYGRGMRAADVTSELCVASFRYINEGFNITIGLDQIWLLPVFVDQGSETSRQRPRETLKLFSS
jgi:hypothetical protein